MTRKILTLGICLNECTEIHLITEGQKFAIHLLTKVLIYNMGNLLF